jgi:hypothetical protein
MTDKAESPNSPVISARPTRTSFAPPHGEAQSLHNAGRLAWGSEPRGEPPNYTGLDVVIVRDGKIAALYVFLDPVPVPS